MTPTVQLWARAGSAPRRVVRTSFASHLVQVWEEELLRMEKYCVARTARQEKSVIWSSIREARPADAAGMVAWKRWFPAMRSNESMESHSRKSESVKKREILGLKLFSIRSVSIS